MEQQCHIGGTLYIVLAAEGVDAATRTSHVAQQQLDVGKGFDVLAAHRMLGDAHGIHDVADLIRGTGRSEQLDDFQIFVLGGASNFYYGVNVIA